jgi:hypothetical protein
MKHIKANRKVTAEEISVSIPKDLEFQILGALIKDLGFDKNALPNEIVDDLSENEHVPLMFKTVRARNHDGVGALSNALSPRRTLGCLTGAKYEAFSFFAQYQIGAFLKKYPARGSNSKHKALKKFRQFEKRCRLWNKENWRALCAINSKHPDFLGVIEEIRSDILGLLGAVPNINSVNYNAKHGPGVAVGDQYPGGMSTEYFKWATLPYTVTDLALPYAKSAILDDPRWIGALDDWYRREENIPLGMPINMTHFWSRVTKVVEGSRITTVPKSIDIDRTIAIEPLLNVFLQLGVGTVIERRLKTRWGYDLHDQGMNQDLSKEASITNEMATIDLQGASDSIALLLCALLLPPAWYDLLFDLRSPIGELDGESITFEKISSMGNGYTFALETVIFGALVRCAMRRTGSRNMKSAVYGDDIILPTTAVDYLKTLLSLCGFSMNDDKSFVNGPFRESCGCDSFLGYDVRPVFLSKKISNVKDLFYLHNAFWALRDRLDWTWGVDFRETISLIRKYIPKKISEQFYGQVGESLDTYLFSNRKPPRNIKGERYGYRLVTRPLIFNTRSREFFFRKLMVSLRPKGQDIKRWDENRTPDSGNAFDIVIRDCTVVKCTKCRVWQ